MSKNNIQYAHPLARVLTYFIDALIYGMIMIPIVSVFINRLQLSQEELQILVMEKGFDGVFTTDQLLIIQLTVGLITMSCWFFIKSSPSKYFLNIRIVDAKTLGKLTLWQCLLRYAGLMICFFTFGIGFLLIFITPKKQGLHDKMANSVVINKVNIPSDLSAEGKNNNQFKA